MARSFYVSEGEMRLICKKSMTYNTRRLLPGDPFEAAKPSDARVLVAIGKAEHAPQEAVKKPVDDDRKPVKGKQAGKKTKSK